jgi:hypothetical protein
MTICRIAYTQRLQLCILGVHSDNCSPYEASELGTETKNRNKSSNALSTMASTKSPFMENIVGTDSTNQVAENNGMGQDISKARKCLSFCLNVLCKLRLISITEVY